MLNIKDAYVIFANKIPNRKVVKCIEYDSLFVFQTVSVKFKGENADEVFDSLYSVNKKTKEVRNFKPFDIPLDEYRRGKEVKIPK